MSDSEKSQSSDVLDKKTRKRKSTGRVRDVLKKLRVQSHEAGADCKCRQQCFETVPLQVRDDIIRKFNLLESVNEQNSYLCGLISIVPVQKRRPRLDSENATMKDVSCKYKVRSVTDNQCNEYSVCRKAFTAIHGITKKKVEVLLNSLKMTGASPKDQRGKHSNRKHKLHEETVEAIRTHISSFKGRGAHYCLHDSSKKYLPEDLNISKMHKMFLEKNAEGPVSYESYRSIFNKDFNISFGFPRTDTCSYCDEHNIKLEALKADLKNAETGEEKKKFEDDLKKIEIDLKLHKTKAEKFYDVKRKARFAAKKTPSFEAICIDFGKNLCIPNITTNDAYYKRQLSVYCFIVHTLSNGKCVFYLYPETQGKKGSEDVCQMLFHFVNNHLPKEVENLQIFADSCGGQNKNINMFRFLHFLVHSQKRFKSVQLTYPIRGHSYTECDRDMAFIKSNFGAETPHDWALHLSEARQNPSPFLVEEIDYKFWRKWTTFFELTYNKKLPVFIRPIREVKIVQTAERLLYFRNTYCGHWDNVVLTLPVRKRFAVDPSALPESTYEDVIPVSNEKYKDVVHLSKFCKSQAAVEYLIGLKHEDKKKRKKVQ